MATEHIRKRKRERTRWGPDDGEDGAHDLHIDTVVSPSSERSREAEHEAVQPQAAAEPGAGVAKRKPKRRRWGSEEEDEGSAAGQAPNEQQATPAIAPLDRPDLTRTPVAVVCCRPAPHFRNMGFRERSSSDSEGQTTGAEALKICWLTHALKVPCIGRGSSVEGTQVV